MGTKFGGGNASSFAPQLFAIQEYRLYRSGHIARTLRSAKIVWHDQFKDRALANNSVFSRGECPNRPRKALDFVGKSLARPRTYHEFGDFLSANVQFARISEESTWDVVDIRFTTIDLG